MRDDVPQFLQEQLTEQLGQADAERVFAGYGARRAVTLRVNRLKSEPAAVRAALERAGVRTEGVPWSEDALVLPERSRSGGKSTCRACPR